MTGLIINPDFKTRFIDLETFTINSDWEFFLGPRIEYSSKVIL